MAAEQSRSAAGSVRRSASPAPRHSAARAGDGSRRGFARSAGDPAGTPAATSAATATTARGAVAPAAVLTVNTAYRLPPRDSDGGNAV